MRLQTMTSMCKLVLLHARVMTTMHLQYAWALMGYKWMGYG